MKKIIIFLSLFIGIGFLSSCINDWKQFIEEDTSNLTVDSITLQPAFAAHLGSAEFKISDLLEEKPDTLEFVGDDSLITFTMAIDTLYEMSVAEVYEMPAIDPIAGQSFSMNDIKIDALSADRNILLSEVLAAAGYTGATTGTVIFPSIPSVPAGDYAYDSFDSFEKVTFASGEFTVQMTNNTPITVSVTMGLRNSDGTYVGNDVVFTNVAPGATVFQTVDVAGESMTKDVTGEFKSFSSPGTIPNSVNLDGTESFHFIVSTTKDLIVATATAKIPLTEITDSTLVNITPADNPDLNIKNITLSTGTINFTVNSGFGAPMTVNIEMPFTKDASGNPLTKSFLFTGSGSQTQSIDLSNTVTDLTMNGDTTNSFFVKYKASIGGDTILYTFSSPATATIDASFDNINFDLIEGSLGTIAPFDIAQDKMDLGIEDITSKLSGEIKITNPSINIKVYNSFGFGAHLDLNVKGYRNGNTDADTVVLSLPSTDINPGTLTEDVFTGIDINNSTSNIVDLIALPPAGIVYSGSVSVSNTDNVFVKGTSRVLTGLGITVPLEINLNNVAFTDTMSLDSATVPKEIKAATLLLNSTNGFPLEISLSVDLYDSIDNVVLHTIDIKNTDGDPVFLSAAAVDNQGKITPSENSLRINLNQTDFDFIQKANALILKAKFSTYDASSGNGVPFNANSKLKIDIAVAAQAEITTK